MDTLFTHIETTRRDENAPLAARMRPTTLEGFVGQAKAVGPGSWLRRAIEHDTLSSVILYGPAGTGKTTLARIIAHTTHAEFVEVSAVTGTVKDLRREIEAARSRLLSLGRRTILFVDEIHRFNRGQQDALLHAVEDRTVVLVGATTENPYFEVNSALISRSRVVELTALDDDAIRELLRRAVADERGLAGAFVLTPEAEDEIVTLAGGDGRAALTSLELASQMVDPPAGEKDDGSPLVITAEHVLEANPRRGLPYDKAGDMHYDVISAFIKSMRGSDPDAVLYWLARMLDAGEDPKFIARRIMICASEDIGNADPTRAARGPRGLSRHGGHRYAGVPHQPGAGGHLPRARAQVQRRRGRDRRRARGGAPRAAPRGCRATCATATAPAPMSTAPTSTRTTTRPAGWSSATCPRAWSAAASTTRAAAAGRRGARRPSAASARTRPAGRELRADRPPDGRLVHGVRSVG